MTNVVQLKRPEQALESMAGLARKDVEWMCEALTGLRQLDTSDRKEFQSWLAVVSQRLGTGEEMAAHFGVSSATFSRWINGSNLPPTYARPAIIDRLRQLVIVRAELPLAAE